MKRFLFMFPLIATLFTAGLAAAEIRPGSREFGIHAGAFFGDDLTDQSILGRRPELDDAFVLGAHYLYHPTMALGVEGRYTFVPSEVKNAPGGGSDMNVHLLDLNLHWNANPRDPINYYLITGIGWARGDLDGDIILGSVAGVPARISDDSGFTYNVGLGAATQMTERISLKAEGRYRYIDRLVDRFEESLNTWEATVGIGWGF
ncbi:outer membrane protein [Candidatus Manganitrophus noduliformans]|nr:outer membrane beta-barrel protein [Candidatus Manganitrophus noduliformans]